MKFIKPNEISSKIMTLIQESDKYVIIVSPYVKISKWYKLLKKFNNLSERKIPIEFIIRDDKSNQLSFTELNELGIKYKAIKDLHCKLYLNEKYAIVSSMNLLLSSEINSLEIAYRTETEEEINELREFCSRYLNINFQSKECTTNEYVEDLMDYVCNKISEKLDKNVRAELIDGDLQINTGVNRYDIFIWNSKQNLLRISGILSGKEYNYLSNNQAKMPDINDLNAKLQSGGNRHYDQIWGTSITPLKSISLDEVFKDEKLIIADNIIDFIVQVDGFKKWAFQSRILQDK